MSLNSATILDKLVSHAMTLGVFERVNTHEPKKNMPSNGLHAAIWVESISPAKSGLAKTSVRMVFTLRIYQNFIAEPQDMIDPEIIAATDLLLNAYSADFELGGTIRNLDLLGHSGTALSARSGYIDFDKQMTRVMDITIPLIVNDVWEQVA